MSCELSVAILERYNRDEKLTQLFLPVGVGMWSVPPWIRYSYQFIYLTQTKLMASQVYYVARDNCMHSTICLTQGANTTEFASINYSNVERLRR